MSDFLTMAYSRSSSLATAAYEQATRLKQVGELPIVSSMEGSGLASMNAQSAGRSKYRQFRGWLYAAIDALSCAAASQPVVVARVKRSLEEERSTPAGQKFFLEQKMPPAMRVKTTDQGLELVQDHPLCDLLENPNSVQDRWQFVYSFVANLNITGRAYLVGGMNKKMNRVEVWSLPTNWVTPDHKDGPFTKFKVQNPSDPDVGKGIELGRENVAFAYLPNPSNPLGAMAPADAQGNAIRIDDHIQTSQEKFFENGIFPSVVVTVGRDPHPDVPAGIRPRLSPIQRRQVISAITKTMGGIYNYGHPALIDGLIERIDRFSATQNEMGWEKSEGTVRTRILSAYGVHPFMLGEPMNVGGWAQAGVIKSIFFDRVNPFLNILTGLANSFIVPMVEPSGELKAWWEICIPKDPSIEAVDWREARKNGDVTRNEVRARLGLPPDEGSVDRAALLSTVGGMSGAVQILTAMGNGLMSSVAAAWLLSTFFEIPLEDVQTAIGGSESRPVGEVIETLQAVANELKRPVRVEFNETDLIERLAESEMVNRNTN